MNTVRTIKKDPWNYSLTHKHTHTDSGTETIPLTLSSCLYGYARIYTSWLGLPKLALVFGGSAVNNMRHP